MLGSCLVGKAPTKLSRGLTGLSHGSKPQNNHTNSNINVDINFNDCDFNDNVDADSFNLAADNFNRFNIPHAFGSRKSLPTTHSLRS